MRERERPLDVLLLREEALEDAFLAVNVAFQATQGVNEGLQAEATSVEGLDRIPAKPLPLRSVT